MNAPASLHTVPPDVVRTSAAHVWFERIRETPDGPATERLGLPIDCCWSRPVSLKTLAGMFGVDRKTLAARIAAGDVVTRPFGSLLRVRIDSCPEPLLPGFGSWTAGEICGIASHLGTSPATGIEQHSHRRV